jgi:hypothetical protein
MQQHSEGKHSALPRLPTCKLTSWANAFNTTTMQRLTTTDVRSVSHVVCALERKSHIELDEKRIRVGSGELLQACGVRRRSRVSTNMHALLASTVPRGDIAVVAVVVTGARVFSAMELASS